MTTIIAGSPGDPEVTPLTNKGECAGNMTHTAGGEADGLPKTGPNPMAMCRDNYGFGYVQAVNRTHLHWNWKMTVSRHARRWTRAGPAGATASTLFHSSCRPR